MDNDMPSENALYISFPKNEYEYMMHQMNLFDEINKECALLIDDYEEDIIQAEHIVSVERLLKGHENYIPTFIMALETAKKHGTYLEVAL